MKPNSVLRCSPVVKASSRVSVPYSVDANRLIYLLILFLFGCTPVKSSSRSRCARRNGQSLSRSQGSISLSQASAFYFVVATSQIFLLVSA
jgi:hypothetical protein